MSKLFPSDDEKALARWLAQHSKGTEDQVVAAHEEGHRMFRDYSEYKSVFRSDITFSQWLEHAPGLRRAMNTMKGKNDEDQRGG